MHHRRLIFNKSVSVSVPVLCHCVTSPKIFRKIKHGLFLVCSFLAHKICAIFFEDLFFVCTIKAKQKATNIAQSQKQNTISFCIITESITIINYD